MSNKATHFHDQIAYAWDFKYCHRDEFIERQRLFTSMIIKYSHPQNYVLDIGCGTGVFSFEALSHNSHVVGVDGSRVMISLCEEKRCHVKSGEQDRITFVESDIAGYLSCCRLKFDLVICSSVLEYLDDLRGTLQAIGSCLNNSGTIIFSLPNSSSIHRFIEKQTYKFTSYPKYFAHVRTITTLQYAIHISASLGLKDISSHYFTPSQYLPGCIPEKYRNEMFLVAVKLCS